MSNPILDQVYGAAGAAEQSINNALFAISGANTEQQDITHQNIELNLDLGKQEDIIKSAQLQGTMEAQKDHNAFALAIGADLGDTTGTLSKLASQFNQATAVQQEALQEVNAKRQINPLTNPIEWIASQFTINNDINKYNAATTTKNQAEGTIDSINKMVQQRAQTDAALQKTTSDAALAATSQEIADKAKINANQARAQGVMANIATAEKLAGMSSAQLDTITKVLSASNAQEQLQMAHEHLDIARAQEQDRLEKKKETEEGYAQIAGDINRGLSIMYPNHPERIAQVASPATLAQIKGGVPMSPELKAAYDIGVNNRIAGDPDHRILANSPFDMLQVLQYKPDLSPAQNHTAQLLIDAQQDLVNHKAPPEVQQAYEAAVQSKDKNAVENAYNKYVKAKIAAEGLKVDGPTNIFYQPAIDKIAAQVPGLQTLDTYRTVIAPAVEAKLDLSEPSQVVKLTAQAIQEKKISLNQAAADLRTIYGTGAIQGATARTLAGMGLDVPHVYNVRIQSAGSFSSSIVNMTDTTEVLKTLMQQLQAMQRVDMQQFEFKPGRKTP